MCPPRSFSLPLSLLVLFGAVVARADDAPRQLGLLHVAALPVDEALSDAVDAALREALTTQLANTEVQTSSAPFEDVALVAGCGDDEASCLDLIAHQLDCDVLLVSRLSPQPGSAKLLSLMTYDARVEQPAARTRKVSGTLASTESAAVEQAVGGLLAKVGLARPESPPVAIAPVVSSEPASSPLELDRTHAPPARWPARLGWSLSAVGGVMLGAGLISGVLSRRDERRYARVTIDDADAVDDARSLLSSAQRRARFANGFFVAGAVTALAGVSVAVWRWAAQRDDRGSAALSLRSTPSDVMLVINGSWQGRAQ